MRAVVFVFALLLAVSSALVIHEPRSQIGAERTSFPKSWSVAGFAAPEEEVRFVLGLKQRNLDVLEAKFWAVSDPTSPEYQNFMTQSEILNLIAPEEQAKDAVIGWLHKQGVVSVEDRRDNIAVTTTVAIASKVFQAKFFRFQHNDRKVNIVRSMGVYSLPSHILDIVDMVAGVSDFPMIGRSLHAVEGRQGVVPEVLNAQYNVPAGTKAPGVSQGVAEFSQGQFYSPSDLQAFAKQVNISIPALTSDHVHNPLPPVGIEGTLDIQYIATTGVGAVNWYWTEQNWLYEFSTSFFAATTKPDVISISYGWSETNQCEISGGECSVLGVDSEQYVAKVNVEFQKIGLTGISLLCASGDSGANGRTDPTCSDPKLKPSFPAASPYITAVGATQLNNPTTPISNPPPACTSGTYSCNSGGVEAAVSYDHAHFASGGGFSNYAPQPSYQSAAVAAYFKSGVAMPPASYFNATNRGFPDVASLGSDILIYNSEQGGLIGVGGTSASSPEFAGYMSILNSISKAKSGKTLGFLNPLLYQMAAANPSTFNDVTVGDNICTEQGCGASCKGFKAATGWDPVTGLGTPNVANMVAHLKSM